MQKYLVLFCLFFSPLIWADQDVKPRPIEEIQAEYKQKWSSLVASLEQRNDISFLQKLAAYDQGVSRLKKEYAQARVAEYEKSEVTVTVDHECKGRPSGTTRNCGFRCAERPNEDMFTTEEWVTFTGDVMKENVSEEKACFKLEAKGNTKKTGSVTATFKYRGSFVDYKMIDDAEKLFNSFAESYQ